MRCIFVVTLLVIARPVSAQKFEFGKYDDVKDVKTVEWTAAAEAGLVLTTGSAETTTATGGIRASRRTGNNKLEFEASGAYAKSGIRIIMDRNGNGLIDNESEIITAETITAEMLASRLRYDRFLSEMNSLYTAALASRDTPAGKQFVFGGQLGYSRSLVRNEKRTTVVEVGYDFSREDLSTGSPVDIHSARGFVGHKDVMSEGVQLDASGELLTNVNTLTLPTTDSMGNRQDGGPLKDTRVNFKVAVSAKIGLNLAFQMSLEARYDHRPGPLPVKNLAPGFVPEAASFDTIMKASFIYTFVGATKPKQ
jgi:hypothetical protein